MSKSHESGAKALPVHAIRRHSSGHAASAPVVDHVDLDYDGRLLRRRRLTTAGGMALAVDLAEVTSVEQGDLLLLADGRAVEVRAAPEALLELRGDLVPLAWHIGNRHTPCQFGADALRIRDDHVLADMARRLGAEVVPVTAAFSPEGGAYGHGRTFGHDHGHHHSHDHGHDHHHGHDHGHDH
jgi:urease accessory protein